MNMTLEEYRRYKLHEQLTDADILEKKGYARSSKRAMMRWKKKVGLPNYTRKVALLDLQEVKDVIKVKSIKDSAEHFGLTYQNFNLWLKQNL